MKLIDKIVNKIAPKLGYIKEETARLLIAEHFTAQNPNIFQEYTYWQLADNFKSWVYTCIDKIAKSIASVPLRLYVYRRNGQKILDAGFRHYYKSLNTQAEKKYYLKQVGVEKEEVLSHPFLSLMNKPNSTMTRFMLWYETLVRLELGGACGWYLVKNGLKLPQEVWTLPLTKTGTLTPKINPDMTLEKWTYRDGNVVQTFQPSEILFHHYPSPDSPWKGMSPLMAQTYPYNIDLYLMQQQEGLFKNGVNPGLVMSTDVRMNTQQVKEMQDYINENYAGSLKSGKTLFFHSGMKPASVGFSSKDAMIDEVARFVREKIITSYDLSEGKLGLVRDVNRANMEALEETFVKDCQKPKTMMLEETIENFLLPIYDRGLTCDFELPDLENKEMKIKETESRLTTLQASVNDILKEQGKEPVPWGDYPFIPFNMMPWSPGKPQQQQEPPQKVAEPEVKDLKEDARDVAWKIFARRTEAFEPILKKIAQEYFAMLKDEVLDRLHKYGKRISGTYAGWGRQKIQEHIGNNKGLDDINISKYEEMARIRGLFEPSIKVIWEEVGNARMKEFGMGIAFRVDDPKALEVIGKRMDLFSKEVTNNTFDSIKAILRDGFTEGLPLTVIGQTLSDKFEKWDKYRASMIARTETIYASNWADLSAVVQAGLEEKLMKHWLSARDGAVRPTHAEADAIYAEKGIGILESFQVGGDAMLSPGEGTDPGENINCRCTLFYTQKEAPVERPTAPGRQRPAPTAVWKDAETIKEAKANLRETFGIQNIKTIPLKQMAEADQVMWLNSLGNDLQTMCDRWEDFRKPFETGKVTTLILQNNLIMGKYAGTHTFFHDTGVSELRLANMHRGPWMYKLKDPDGLQFGKGMHLAGESSLPMVFRHEFGHCIWYQNLNNTQRSTWTQFFRSHTKDWWSKTVSRYASVNEKEAFAEVFSQFVTPGYGKDWTAMGGVKVSMGNEIDSLMLELLGMPKGGF